METSRPTSHEDPTYLADGVIHYCVRNMPALVPATATHALTNATMPYVAALADHGLEKACHLRPGLVKGRSVGLRQVSDPAVAELFDMDCVDPETIWSSLR